MTCDELRVIAESPGSTAGSLTMTRLLAADTVHHAQPGFAVLDEAAQLTDGSSAVLGQLWVPTGAVSRNAVGYVKIDISPGDGSSYGDLALRLFDLDDSGHDGVRTALSTSESEGTMIAGMMTNIDAYANGPTSDNGTGASYLELAAEDEMDALQSLRFTRVNEDELEITVDFSTLGAATYTLKVYDENGVRVYHETGRSGPVARITPATEQGSSGDWVETKPYAWPSIGLTVAPGPPLQIPGGVTLPASAGPYLIFMLGEVPGANNRGAETITMRGLDITEILVTDIEPIIVGDVDGNGRVDIDDIVTVALNFG
jgi:hypothetical protein